MLTIGNLHFYQIAIVLISIIMIFFGVEKYWRRQATHTILKLGVRIFVWGGMSAVALFPELSNHIASFIGIEGNINAVVLLGFLLVFLLVFKILSVVERLEQQISSLVREDALSTVKESKRK